MDIIKLTIMELAREGKRENYTPDEFIDRMKKIRNYLTKSNRRK